MVIIQIIFLSVLLAIFSTVDVFFMLLIILDEKTPKTREAYKWTIICSSFVVISLIIGLIMLLIKA